MPIAPAPRLKPGRALVVGLIALAIGIGVIVAIVLLAESGDVELGPKQQNEFEAGRITVLEENIAESGPILIQDPNGDDVNIYIQQLEDSSWTAFRAHISSSGEVCKETIRWNPAPKIFTDPCGSEIILTLDGCVDLPANNINPPEELVHYGTRIVEGRLLVDLGSPDESFCG